MKTLKTVLKHLYSVIVIGMTLLLTSCATATDGDFCSIAMPIYYSALYDTEETIVQIREHNAIIEDLCY